MIDYIVNFYHLYIHMAYYMVFGLIVVALMKIFLNAAMISKYVGNNSLKSVILASALGVPLPLCSCGVLPTAIELNKSGAGIGPTASFLIATPQIGITSIAATYGLMGLFMAIFRPIAAFISGIIGGLFVGAVNKKKEENNVPESSKHSDNNEIHSCCSKQVVKEELKPSCCAHKVEEEKACCAHSPIKVEEKKEGDCPHCKENQSTSANKFRDKIISSIKYAFVNFINDIALPFILGVAVAALISVLIPDNFFHNIGLSNSLLAMLLMIIIGLPMYICATSSIPIAIALIMKGISPGAAFVFLFVGPVTNIASILLLVKSIGKKATISYIISVIVLAISFGLLLDFLVSVFNISFNLMSHTGEHTMSIFMLSVAGLFTIMLIYSLFNKARRRLSRS